MRRKHRSSAEGKEAKRPQHTQQLREENDCWEKRKKLKEVLKMGAEICFRRSGRVGKRNKEQGLALLRD
jgi:hypothetical protein